MATPNDFSRGVACIICEVNIAINIYAVSYDKFVGVCLGCESNMGLEYGIELDDIIGDVEIPKMHSQSLTDIMNNAKAKRDGIMDDFSYFDSTSHYYEPDEGEEEDDDENNEDNDEEDYGHQML